MTLSLYGIAARASGFEDGPPWRVVRVREPSFLPSHHADAALIHSPSELAAAVASGFDTAVVIGPDLDVDVQAFRRLLVLQERFAYLADGDVLGVTTRTHRFRTSTDEHLLTTRSLLPNDAITTV